MQQAVSKDPTKPELLVPPANPYYRVPCGSQSHYGDQMLTLMRSLVHCKGTCTSFTINNYYKIHVHKKVMYIYNYEDTRLS